MSSLLGPALLAAVTLGALPGLPGCYHDASDHERRGGCHRGDGPAAVDFSCPKGVSIDLGNVARRFEGKLPVSVMACFDDDCDEVTLVAAARGLVCDGKEGGPLDQLTSCSLGSDGSLHMDIARVDGATYTDGREHTAAVSVLDQGGELVFQKAAAVSLGTGCGLTPVDATR
jgi:hypothetical protein